MKIAALEKCSFVDWPGMMAATVFTPGCNLDCYYCHNRLLLGARTPQALIPAETLVQWLESRRTFLDGVVVTGGEPTLQPKLPEFLRQLKTLGFPVKLDTNGARPHVLHRLLDAGLVNYVAMDLKATETKYDEVCGVHVDQAAIQHSIDLLMTGDVNYEFRTTVLPHFTEDDIDAMARRITGARRYFLQQFRPPAGDADRPDMRLARKPLPEETLHRMAQRAREHVASCDIRGLLAAAPTASA